nr:hypothetical protein [Tanacetum cinerariifolium]
MGGTIRGYDAIVVKWKSLIRPKVAAFSEHQLRLDEEALRETLEEEANAEKDWEERMKKEQAKDELFRLKFGVKSDSEYELD